MKKTTPKKASTEKSALRRPVDDAAKKVDVTIESDLEIDQVDVKNFIIKKKKAILY